MSVLILDNFTDTDLTALPSHTVAPTNTPGHSWVAKAGAFEIASNQVFNSTPATPAVVTIDAGVADADVKFTSAAALASTQAGLCVRFVDINNHFAVWFKTSDNTIQFFRIQGGSFNSLGSFSHTESPSDVLEVSVSGDTWNVSLNGSVVIGPVTDAFQNTATLFGLWAYGDDTSTRWEDFTVTVAGGGDTLMPQICL